jgi:intracellular sulfur oxidation DsrE/DsrF family protein
MVKRVIAGLRSIHAGVASRRQFVGAAAFAGIGILSGETPSEHLAIQVTESWLDNLHGRHKQFFDVSALSDGAPLDRVWGYFDVYHDAYGLSDHEIDAVVGAHGSALGFVLTDAVWAAYDLGKIFSVKDPQYGTVATRNLFAEGATGTVSSLQRRGARFLACQRSIDRLSRQLATASGKDPARVRAELEGGLLPRVTLVPAMIVATNRAQEAGLTYVHLG